MGKLAAALKKVQSVVIHFFRAIWLVSIWAPGSVPEAEKKYANMKRIFIPCFDGIMAWAGFAAISRGIPAMEAVLSEHVADQLGWGLVIVANTCLIGITFPRLWVMELVAKSGLMIILMSYFFSLRIQILQTATDTRSFLSVIVFASMVLILIRINILTYEWQERRDDKAARKAGLL